MSWIKLGRKFNGRTEGVRSNTAENDVKVGSVVTGTGRSSMLRVAIGMEVAKQAGIKKGTKILVSAQNDGAFNGKLRFTPSTGDFTCTANHSAPTSKQLIVSFSVPIVYKVESMTTAVHRIGERGLIVELPNYKPGKTEAKTEAKEKKAPYVRAFKKRKRTYSPETLAVFRENAAKARMRKSLLAELRDKGILGKSMPRIGDPDFPKAATIPAPANQGAEKGA
jgi:hypothetical protein